MTRILAIETSCDETAAAVIEAGRYVRSNVVATQIELHRRFGGVFPEVASRQHVLAIEPVIRQALDEAHIDGLASLDAIAVTHGPGLAGSLLVGVNAAKGISFASGLPLLPINHLEGHIYSNWIVPDGNESPATRTAHEFPADEFPVVVLIVSGGHTELIAMRDHCQYQRLGGTLDDAAGEAFDKVARLLELGFPGGPAIQTAAKAGDAVRFELPRPLLGNADHRFNFSFSGLKTAVRNLVKQLEADGVDVRAEQTTSDIAASFQAAVVDVLVAKTLDAVRSIGARRVCICGGVSANQALRSAAAERLEAAGFALSIPPLYLCTDNAAMIGAAAHFRWRHAARATGDLSIDVSATLPLVES